MGNTRFCSGCGTKVDADVLNAEFLCPACCDTAQEQDSSSTSQNANKPGTKISDVDRDDNQVKPEVDSTAQVMPALINHSPEVQESDKSMPVPEQKPSGRRVSLSDAIVIVMVIGLIGVLIWRFVVVPQGGTAEAQKSKSSESNPDVEIDRNENAKETTSGNELPQDYRALPDFDNAHHVAYNWENFDRADFRFSLLVKNSKESFELSGYNSILKTLGRLPGYGNTDAKQKKKKNNDYYRIGNCFFIHPDGLALTCLSLVRGHHVLIRMGKVLVPAEVVAMELKTDLALLKIPKSKLPFVKFGNSETVKVADKVFITGQPYSHQSHDLATKLIPRGVSGFFRDDVKRGIQLDAVLAEGFSGGPVVDEFGRLIGIANEKFKSKTHSGELVLQSHTIQQFLESNNIALPIQERQAEETPSRQFSQDAINSCAMLFGSMKKSRMRVDYQTRIDLRSVSAGTKEIKQKVSREGKFLLDRNGHILETESNGDLRFFLLTATQIGVEELNWHGMKKWNSRRPFTLIEPQIEPEVFDVDKERSGRFSGRFGSPEVDLANRFNAIEHEGTLVEGYEIEEVSDQQVFFRITKSFVSDEKKGDHPVMSADLNGVVVYDKAAGRIAQKKLQGEIKTAGEKEIDSKKFEFNAEFIHPTELPKGPPPKVDYDD